jgi:DNA polymerase type B, organellar and viral
MGRKSREDVLWDGSVRLWHAWRDKPGMSHYPVFWDQGRIYTMYGKLLFSSISSPSELVHTIAHHKLFVLCRDVLSEEDIPYANELLGYPRVRPYLARSGSVAALRVAEKKSSGFLVPGRTWCYPGVVNAEVLEHLISIFLRFDFMSSTPSSLAEKILRGTIPDTMHISRPSLALRRDILDHHRGGRIDQASSGHFYKEAYEYDKIKAYLSHARYVPNPALAPVIRHFPDVSDALAYPCGYWLVTLIARARVVSPLSLDGRSPQEGEIIHIWLWSFELKDCLEAGYTLVEITRGYGFRAMSSFMEEWSDILFQAFEETEGELERDIIKSMMVGLPGRFLRRPEIYTLIPLSEARKRTPGQDDGDIPLRLHIDAGWKSGDRIFSDYAIRAEYDQESTALSQVGAYIVAAMRHELYQRMLDEHKAGNVVIRSYIDCFTTTQKTQNRDILGTHLGQWKEQYFEGPFYAEANRFVGMQQGIRKVVAPGMEKDSEERNTFAGTLSLSI